MDTAFQSDAFQTEELAFQIDVGGAPPAEPEPTTSTRVIYWGDYIENLRAHAQSLRDQVITDDEDDDWLLM